MTNTPDKKLLPCPLCNSEADYWGSDIVITCTNMKTCGIHTRPFSTKYDATESWNTRAISNTPQTKSTETWKDAEGNLLGSGMVFTGDESGFRTAYIKDGVQLMGKTLSWDEVDKFRKATPNNAELVEEQRRSTDLFDIHGNEIFEGDYILSPCYDKPHSRTKKMKMIKGLVKWVPANIEPLNNIKDSPAMNEPAHWYVDKTADPDRYKYGCGDWNSFFRCEKVMDNEEKQALSPQGNKMGGENA